MFDEANEYIKRNFKCKVANPINGYSYDTFIVTIDIPSFDFDIEIKNEGASSKRSFRLIAR